jgi:hypothetical protein
VALFVVLISLALMSAVVTDLGANEMVRYKLAAHERDSLKAEALAESGVNMARLLLVAQGAIQPQITQLAAAGIPLPAHTIWQLIPLESDILKGMTSGELAGLVGMDVSEDLEKKQELLNTLKETRMEDFDADEEGVGDGPFVPPLGGFGAFEGGFSVKIDDEDRKPASLRGWSTQLNPQVRYALARRLWTVFQPERFDFLFDERDSYGEKLDRWDLVAAIFDFMDSNEETADPTAQGNDWGRLGAGSEEAQYNAYPDGVRPKNAYLDSPQDLLMVRGFTDAHQRAFGDAITLYGEGKVNILSADDMAVETLVRICAENPEDPLLFDPLWMRETLKLWRTYKTGGLFSGGMAGLLGGDLSAMLGGQQNPQDPISGGPVSPAGFVAFLGARFLVVNSTVCTESMGTDSKNFVVRASGTVGNVTRTMTMALRVYRATEDLYFFTLD